MNPRFPLPLAFSLLLSLAALNIVAERFHLFYIVWWLDIPMHLFGGALGALTAVSLYFRASDPHTKDRGALLVWLLSIASSLTIGLGWEAFEYLSGKSAPLGADGLGDTIKDLANDLFGALLGAKTFLLLSRKRAPRGR